MKGQEFTGAYIDEATSLDVRANTDGTTDARSAHVPPAASHARADSWVDRRVDESPEFMAWLQYERLALDQVENPDAFRDAVSAELVACTLGQRSRPELRVDFPGRIMLAVARLRDAFRRAGVDCP